MKHSAISCLLLYFIAEFCYFCRNNCWKPWGRAAHWAAYWYSERAVGLSVWVDIHLNTSPPRTAQLPAASMWVEIILFLAGLFLWFYRYVTKQFDEFEKQGIPFAKPSFPFGSRNAKKLLMGEAAFFDVDRELGEGEFKNEKIFGYFMTGQPTLVINDHDLAKLVLIKDFDHFTDLRHMGYEAETKDAQIMKYMFANLKGEMWKKVRAVMSGVFTAGKLKIMTPYLTHCGENMSEYLGQSSQEKEYEARELVSRFAIDSLATSSYGLEVNSFSDPENNFRKMALRLASAPGYGTNWDLMNGMFIMMAPRLAKLFSVPNFPRQPLTFLSHAIESTYRHRKASGHKRNDIIDHIIEEMNNSGLAEEFTEKQIELLLVSNAIMFFFAGFDTQAISLSIVIHQLVKHEEVQDKLLVEIDSVLENSNGEVTYDTIQDMKYMDMVIQESLR